MYSTEEQVDTEGDWCHGQLIGEYRIYDKYGNVCSEGYQINGQHVKDTLVLKSLSQLHCYLRHVVIGDNALNTIRTLNLDSLRYLETLEVGSRSCRQCRTVNLSNLSLLRSLQIGDYSFTQYDTSLDLLLSESKTILDMRKSLRLESLHALEDISIGDGSFSDFSHITVADMSVLQVLTIGSCCFFYAKSLQLRDLLLLSTVTLGAFSFYHGSSVELHDLPSLVSFTSGRATFFRSLSEELGTCSLQNLPSLTEFICLEESFASISTLRLSDTIGSNSLNRYQLKNCFWSLLHVRLSGEFNENTKGFLTMFAKQLQ